MTFHGVRTFGCSRSIGLWSMSRLESVDDGTA
jgi:hypothetical protein